MTTDDNEMLRAMINDASRPDAVRDAALASEQAYRPHQWTEAEVTALMESQHGTEAERIANL